MTKLIDLLLNIVIFGIFVILFGIMVIFIEKKDYLMSIFSIILMIILGIIMFKRYDSRKIPLQKIKIIKEYLQLMESQYFISIYSNWSIYKDDETRDKYIIILKDIEEETSMIRYFPFECNKFDYIFGRGTGSVKYSVTEVNNWLVQNTKINVKEELYADILERTKRKTLEDMHGKYDIPREGSTEEVLE